MTRISALVLAGVFAFAPAASAYTFPAAGIAPLDARKVAADGRVAVRVDRERFAAGGVAIELPARTGAPVVARFEKRVEQADGRWTWIAMVDTVSGPQAAVLTFGEGAVFGHIPQPVGAPLRLDTAKGVTWLADTADDVRPDPADSAREARGTPARTDIPAKATPDAPAVPGTIGVKDFGPVPLVDLAIVYTPALLDALGDEATVLTQISYLEAVTNRAFIDSRIPGQVRVVAAEPIDYTVPNDNNSALDDIFKPSTLPVKQQVDALRAQVGADLVMMLRLYDTATMGGQCGVAEINGYHGKPYAASDGFSVVAHGVYPGPSCPYVTFAHELGHNFGSHHDYQTAGGDYGAWNFSRGHRETVGSNGFGTIMSYPSSPQTYVNLYTNPTVTDCRTRPCGIADYADNRRTFAQSLPLIAAYLPTKVPLAPPVLSVADTQGGEVDLAPCEADIEACPLVVRVSLSAPTPYDVTFDIATADGTAIAGSDYVARRVAGMRIPAGMTEAEFRVRTIDDDVAEEPETFRVVVSNIRRAQAGDTEAVVTLVRDAFDYTAPIDRFAGGHYRQYYPDYPADKGDGGPAVDAWLWSTTAIAAGPDGSVYLADPNGRTIRRVSPEGVISTFVSTFPGGISPSIDSMGLDAAGNLYALELVTSSVWKITPGGGISRFAGNGAKGFSGDGGPATSAGFEDPWCLAVAPDGRVVVGDNSRLREIGTDGTMRTIAGTGTVGDEGDGGPASAASVKFWYDCDVAFDDAGNLYFSGHDRIRRIGADGVITRVAGTDQWPEPEYPYGERRRATDTVVAVQSMAVDRLGGIVFFHRDHGLRRITPDGWIDAFGMRLERDGQYANPFVSEMTMGPGGALYLMDMNQTATVWRVGYPGGVPSAPRNPVAVAGNRMASLTFAAPADAGGAPVDAYEVEVSPSGGVDAAAGTAATTRQILGLTNGTSYRLRVRARNAHGLGPWSPRTGAVVPTTAGAVAITIDDASVVEGASGTRTIGFTVRLSAPAPGGGVGFRISTVAGTAAAGSDFVALDAGGRTIAAGQSSATFAITVNGDTVVEPDETFDVVLTEVVGAAIGRDRATGTIRNDDARLSIRDMTIAEGHAGTRVAEIAVELQEPVAAPVGFSFATLDGTAVAGTDYLARDSRGNAIVAGERHAMVQVQIIGDEIPERDESFRVRIADVTGASVADSEATVTIRNDDAVPSLAGVERLEGDATSTVPLTVTLSTPAPAGGVSFDLATRDATATGGVDYTAIAQVVSFPAGAASATVPLTIRGDTTFEGDEEFTVELTAKSGTFASPVIARVALYDDDYPATATIDTVVGSEYAYQGFELENRRADEVYLRGVGDIAGAPDGTLHFTQANQVWRVDAGGVIRRVAGVEGDPGFAGDGGPATSARLSNSLEIGFDAQGRLLIADIGNARLRAVTADGVIRTIAGNGEDVISGDGGPAVEAGIRCVCDLAVSPDGTAYFLDYAENPRRVLVRRVARDGTIDTIGGDGAATVDLNADAPDFVLADTSFGLSQVKLFGARDDGTLHLLIYEYRSFLFRVDPDGVAHRIAGVMQGPSLTDATAYGPATDLGYIGHAAVDPGGAVHVAYIDGIFRIGTSGVLEPIAGRIGSPGFSGDGGPAIAARLDGPQAMAMDASGGLLVWDSDNVRIRRIGGLVALPGAPTGVVAVPGTATATVSFAAPASAGSSPIIGYDVYSTPGGGIDPGGLSRSRTITGLATDRPYTFRVRARSALGAGPLSEPSNAIVADAASLSIADAQITEGDTGSRTLSFTVTLSKAAAAPVTFSWATANGTATAGKDYVAVTAGKATIPAGGTSVTLPVSVLGDVLDESDETFRVTLSDPKGAAISRAEATGRILDDDETPPALSIGDLSFDEGDAGITSATFVVQLSRTATRPVSYTIATADGTAKAGSDYVARAATAGQIAVGADAQTFTVHVNGDIAVEADETFRVLVSNVSGATVDVAAATATIRNDDDASAPPPLAARDDRVVLGENASARTLNVLGNDVYTAARLDGGSLTVTKHGAGTTTVQTQGTATAADDRLVYTAPTDFSGEDVVGYRVCEPGGRCADGRLQVVLRPAVDVDASTPDDGGFVDVAASRLRALPAAQFLATPVVSPVVTTLSLPVDTTAWTPWDGGRAGTGTVARGITAATDGQPRTWRVLVDATGGGDVDLYVGVDTDGDGVPTLAERRCVSAMSSVRERCELVLTHPGTGTVRYWAMAHNRTGAKVDAKIAVFEIPDIAGDQRLTATGPGSLPKAASFPVRVAWNDPTLQRGGTRGGYVVVRSNGATVGAFPVRIDRAASAPASARALGTAPLRLRLAPGDAHDRLFIDVPAGASALKVTTASFGNIDLYLAKAVAPSAATSSIPAAPARAQAAASAVGASGNESLTISGAALTPGRWYVTPVNAGGATTDVTVQATITGAGPVLRYGSFFNPSRSGHGIFVYPAGGYWAGLWYTYFEDGTPTWYYVQGLKPGANGVFDGELYRAAWQGTSNHQLEVGRVRITPTGQDDFLFTYTLDGKAGSEPMTSLGRGCPTLSGAPLDVSSHWFNPAKSGTGYSVQMWPTYEYYAAFVYDGWGVPRFLTGERNGFGGAEATIDLEQLKGFCPTCNRTAAPTRAPVGVFTRTFGAGTIQRLQLDAIYRDGVPGAWTGDEGVQALGGPTSVQGCAP